MKYLEVRRHSTCLYPGQNLSQTGVNLARRTGNNMGPFDFVITGTLPCAVQTAIAMGFSVDKQDEQLNPFSDYEFTTEINASDDFSGFVDLIKKDSEAHSFAREQAEFWKIIVQSVPEGAQALVITHGGIIETGVIACFPRGNYPESENSFDYCEGVLLGFKENSFVSAEILRVKK